MSKIFALKRADVLKGREVMQVDSESFRLPLAGLLSPPVGTSVGQ